MSKSIKRRFCSLTDGLGHRMILCSDLVVNKVVEFLGRAMSH